jgi:hypothetical protein
MGNQNDLISDFAAFAKSQFDEHKEQLIKKYTNDASVKEAQRLRYFNEQLHSLKTVLSNKLEEVTTNSPDASVRKELDKQCRHIVNVFLKDNFYSG